MTRHPGRQSLCPQSTDQPASLLDNHGRRITYLRLSITDRCNLRCRYCRPEQGVPFIHHEEILSFEELERLVAIFCGLGIGKVRVTGGEPFSRRGCMPFLERLRQIPGVERLYITTNGVKTLQYLDELAAIRIDGINLSLDTLDAGRFREISRRDYLDSVLETLNGIIKRGIPLKINSVVLEDTTDTEIARLAALAKQLPISLRFIERMPFSGRHRTASLKNGDLARRLHRIFPNLTECATDQPTTARIFTLPGYTGSLGIIQGYSRLFCATCNKLRVTPVGMLKTCLYDNGALDLKKLLRGGAGDREISGAILNCVGHRFANGHEAERSSCRTDEPSMAKIGG
ncbi:MAG: GTP 3',8-cyclase MoaA [Desulfobulbaceae bacterium]